MARHILISCPWPLKSEAQVLSSSLALLYHHLEVRRALLTRSLKGGRRILSDIDQHIHTAIIPWKIAQTGTKQARVTCDHLIDQSESSKLRATTPQLTAPPAMPPPPHAAPRLTTPALPRFILYYQTPHPLSLRPLLALDPQPLTHLVLAALHLNGPPLPPVHLNDHPPAHPVHAALRADARALQARGVRVLALLGGAAPGTFARLDAADDAAFAATYAPLQQTVTYLRLDGLDLDVEEPMSLAGIVRLVRRLKADFGPAFLITMAPVAPALAAPAPETAGGECVPPARNLSGFAYADVERALGGLVAWYHAQFYCGWGDLWTPAAYRRLVGEMGVAGPARVVAGTVTSPQHGAGWVPGRVLARTVRALCRRPRADGEEGEGQEGEGNGDEAFGGVFGWEYYNGVVGRTDARGGWEAWEGAGGEGREPWRWVEWMGRCLRGEDVCADGWEERARLWDGSWSAAGLQSAGDGAWR